MRINHTLLHCALILPIAAAHPTPPTDMLVNHIHNPKAIDVAPPLFSWIMNDPDRGETQSAWQVVVASGDSVVWDMLLQSGPGTNGKLRLLPTWPKDWDVAFKLHAPGKTVVEAVYRGGEIQALKVTPKSRRKDVVMPEGH